MDDPQIAQIFADRKSLRRAWWGYIRTTIPVLPPILNGADSTWIGTRSNRRQDSCLHLEVTIAFGDFSLPSLAKVATAAMYFLPSHR
jgi:hypothetical protein